MVECLAHRKFSIKSSYAYFAALMKLMATRVVNVYGISKVHRVIRIFCGCCDMAEYSLHNFLHGISVLQSHSHFVLKVKNLSWMLLEIAVPSPRFGQDLYIKLFLINSRSLKSVMTWLTLILPIIGMGIRMKGCENMSSNSSCHLE